MSDLMHWIAHLFNLNGGIVVSKYDVDGNLWVGFQCNGCGKVYGKHKELLKEDES